MSKNVYYFYDGCTINVYNVEVDEEKLIKIRKKIMENCCQYNHTIYETIGYPNLMDESKKYLKITDTRKYEINPNYYEWDTDDEVDAKIRIYLVDVIEYIKPNIIKNIDNILSGCFDSVFDITNIAITNSSNFDFEQQKAENLRKQCKILNTINGQNKRELLDFIEQLRKELIIIEENIANNRNTVSVVTYAAEIKDAISYELINKFSIENFNKADIPKLIKSKEKR